ncbi:MAG: D-aminoacyl-tRNA deacylase [Candidatus Bathyarchaeota archaeon]|nr:D-aminoacyl-tRNA deacylase [Candidatus Bathyarchaeota archaeon]
MSMPKSTSSTSSLLESSLKFIKCTVNDLTQKHETPHSNYKLAGKPYSQYTIRGQLMILLVHSVQDVAGVNIAAQLHQLCRFEKTRQTYSENPIYHATMNKTAVTHVALSQESVCAQDLPEHFPDAELIVFMSRHSSQSQTPTLTVHVPGNFAQADFGGLPHTVSVAPAVDMQNALQALNQLHTQTPLGFKVSYEVTHHGPSLNMPALFIELGSSPAQWSNQAAANIVAKATLQTIQKHNSNRSQTAVLGIGGTHYNQKFTALSLSGEAVFGHMIPKYAIAHVDAELLRHCIERTVERVGSVVLDWKGIKGVDKPDLVVALEEVGLPTEKI